MGFSAMVAENLIRKQVKSTGSDLLNIQSGELYLPDSQGNRLPLGTFVRF
jgi:hypothetical protein